MLVEGTGGMHAVNLPFLHDRYNGGRLQRWRGGAAIDRPGRGGRGREPRVYFENFRGREGCQGGTAATPNDQRQVSLHDLPRQNTASGVAIQV